MLEVSEKINKFCYELEDQIEKINLVNSMTEPDELYTLLDYYNWDDGFEIPLTIANHPACELAIALKLYWLAEASDWFSSNDEVNEYNKDHYTFSKLLNERILSGYYSLGKLSHSENFTRVQIYKFKKQGFPEIFYLPIVGI